MTKLFGRTPTFLGALLLAAALAAAAASAGPPEAPGPREPGAVVTRHADRLGLDEPTLDAIRKVANESGARSAELRLQLREEHETLRRLLATDAPDEQEVMRQVESIAALELELRKMRLRSMMQIRNLLTPNQRAKLVEIRQEDAPRRGPRPLEARPDPDPGR